MTGNNLRMTVSFFIDINSLQKGWGGSSWRPPRFGGTTYAVVFGCAWLTALAIDVVAVVRAWTICCRVASTGVMLASTCLATAAETAWASTPTPAALTSVARLAETTRGEVGAGTARHRVEFVGPQRIGRDIGVPDGLLADHVGGLTAFCRACDAIWFSRVVSISDWRAAWMSRSWYTS